MSRPNGISTRADLDVERHLVFARLRSREAQHDHRQRLEDEAPDDAERVRLAEHEHVAAADEDRDTICRPTIRSSRR